MGFLLNSGDLVGVEFNTGRDNYYYSDEPGRTTFSLYAVTGANVWEGYVFVVEVGDYHGSDMLRTRVGGRLQPVEPLGKAC